MPRFRLTIVLTATMALLLGGLVPTTAPGTTDMLLWSITRFTQIATLRQKWSEAENSIAVPTEPVPPDFFGMHVIEKKNWPTVPIGSLGKGTYMSWTYIQRSRESYDWSNLDAWVDLAQQHGVDYFLSFDGFPRWATSDVSSCIPANMPGAHFCSAPPTDLTIIDKFVSALVARYKGRIKFYEIWNEPYIKPIMDVANLVTFAKRVIPLIRSLDPGAKIISPSMNARFGYARYAEKYFALGGPTDVDIISLHAYANEPEDLTPGGPQLGPLLPIIAKYGLGKKPFWNTEGGWTWETGKDLPDTDQQMAFLARYYLIHWSEGLTRFYWYAWDNTRYGTIWDYKSGGASQTARALEQIQRWMIGATLTNRIAPAGTIWSGTFVRPDGRQTRVVWDTSGPSTYSAPSHFTRYRDLRDNVQPIRNNRVPIGIKPVLLEPP